MFEVHWSKSNFSTLIGTVTEFGEFRKFYKSKDVQTSVHLKKIPVTLGSTVDL